MNVFGHLIKQEVLILLDLDKQHYFHRHKVTLFGGVLHCGRWGNHLDISYTCGWLFQTGSWPGIIHKKEERWVLVFVPYANILRRQMPILFYIVLTPCRFGEKLKDYWDFLHYGGHDIRSLLPYLVHYKVVRGDKISPIFTLVGTLAYEEYFFVWG